MTHLNEAELARLCLPVLEEILRNHGPALDDFRALLPLANRDEEGLLRASYTVEYRAGRYRQRGEVLEVCARALGHLANRQSGAAAEALAGLQGITPQAWVAQELALRGARSTWTDEFLRDVAPRLGEENGVGRILRHALHSDRRLDGANPQVKALRAQYPDTGTERT